MTNLNAGFIRDDKNNFTFTYSVDHLSWFKFLFSHKELSGSQAAIRHNIKGLYG